MPTSPNLWNPNDWPLYWAQRGQIKDPSKSLSRRCFPSQARIDRPACLTVQEALELELRSTLQTAKTRFARTTRRLSPSLCPSSSVVCANHAGSADVPKSDSAGRTPTCILVHRYWRLQFQFLKYGDQRNENMGGQEMGRDGISSDFYFIGAAVGRSGDDIQSDRRLRDQLIGSRERIRIAGRDNVSPLQHAGPAPYPRRAVFDRRRPSLHQRRDLD